MPLDSIKVNMKLGIFDISGTWKPDAIQRNAAWEMYVELATRISFAELKKKEGFLSEALKSLHDIFEITRNILKKYGPKVAQPIGKNKISFGYIAVAVLNNVLRPVLAKWHPLLSDYVKQCPPGKSTFEQEQGWDRNEELRKVLNYVREKLAEYITLLAKAAKVESMLKKIYKNENNHQPDIVL